MNPCLTDSIGCWFTGLADLTASPLGIIISFCTIIIGFIFIYRKEIFK